MDCRGLKQACAHARDLARPLNTLVSLTPYHSSLPRPAERASTLNLLLTNIRNHCRRSFGQPFTGLWVWHSDENGRNPHVHVFTHCRARHRDKLKRALVALYSAGVVDVREGSYIRKMHYSGFWGSTLDYLCRFKSQQAWYADSGKANRESRRDENGRRVGIKSPLTGKRWGCTRNIAARAIDLHLRAKTEARATALFATKWKRASVETSALRKAA
jgi:hypothetical protein